VWYYSNKSHFGFSNKYRINNLIKIDNEKSIPIFITNKFRIKAIAVTPQNAKNAHFFQLNKNITQIRFANAKMPTK
jgi:predicted YcjX-like family ATPase